MNSTRTSSLTWTDSFGRDWNRFWFTPSDPTLVSLLRIGIGLVALCHLLSFNSDLVRWFGAEGLLPYTSVRALSASEVTYRITYFAGAVTPGQLWALHLLGLVAALALVAGLATRISAGITFLAVLSFVHRAPMLAGHLEPVLGMLLLYLIIAPAGWRFSVDSLLLPMLSRGKPSDQSSSSSTSALATLSLRLMQVHLSAFYLMMAMTKLYGDAWWDGYAIWHMLAQTHSRPLDLTRLRQGEYLLNGWSHFILFTQLGFPALVWNHHTRPLILIASIVAWLSLIPVTGLTTFCLLMVISCGCFLSPERVASCFGSSPR